MFFSYTNKRKRKIKLLEEELNNKANNINNNINIIIII